MKKQLAILALTGLLALGSSVAQGTPLLQLDILGGTRNTSTETTVAESTDFTLYALLTPQGNDDVIALLADTYFISAAITPRYGPTSGTLGSFLFGSTTVTATSGMTYGTPPLDVDSGSSDPQDLQSHSIFDTFFKEFAFTFKSDQTTQEYNTETDPGGLKGAGTGSYYQTFHINTSGLINPNFAVHFDLYSVSATREPIYGDPIPNCEKYDKDGVCTKWGEILPVIGDTVTDWDINKNAPFSHDAESGHDTPVPEPTSMMLLGTGLICLAGIGKKVKA